MTNETILGIRPIRNNGEVEPDYFYEPNEDNLVDGDLMDKIKYVHHYIDQLVRLRRSLRTEKIGSGLKDKIKQFNGEVVRKFIAASSNEEKQRLKDLFSQVYDKVAEIIDGTATVELMNELVSIIEMRIAALQVKI